MQTRLIPCVINGIDNHSEEKGKAEEVCQNTSLHDCLRTDILPEEIMQRTFIKEVSKVIILCQYSRNLLFVVLEASLLLQAVQPVRFQEIQNKGNRA